MPARTPRSSRSGSRGRGPRHADRFSDVEGPLGGREDGRTARDADPERAPRQGRVGRIDQHGVVRAGRERAGRNITIHRPSSRPGSPGRSMRVGRRVAARRHDHDSLPRGARARGTSPSHRRPRPRAAARPRPSPAASRARPRTSRPPHDGPTPRASRGSRRRDHRARRPRCSRPVVAVPPATQIWSIRSCGASLRGFQLSGDLGRPAGHVRPSSTVGSGCTACQESTKPRRSSRRVTGHATGHRICGRCPTVAAV